MSRTMLLIKPHAVQRGVTGELLARFERMGLRIAAIEVANKPPEFWERFYPSDDAWYRNVGGKTLESGRQEGIDVHEQLGTTNPEAIGKIVKGWLVAHMSSGASIAVVLEGNEAVQKVRSACGSTLPNNAAPGTIRFDYSADSPVLANDEERPVFNLVHASDPDERRNSQPAVEYEIGMFFPNLL